MHFGNAINWVLHERSNITASFPEHLKFREQMSFITYTLSKWFLILVVVFGLSLFTQSVCIKGIYSRNFGCSAKEAVILLLSQSTLDIFSKYIVSWLQFFLFWFATIHPKCICKSNILKKLYRCFAKETTMLLLSWCIQCIVFSNY